MKRIVFLLVLTACGSKIERQAPVDAVAVQDATTHLDAPPSIDAPVIQPDASVVDALVLDASVDAPPNLPQVTCLVVVGLSPINHGTVFTSTVVSGCPITQSATVIITLHFQHASDVSFLQGGFGCGTTASTSNSFADTVIGVTATFSVDQTSQSGDCTIRF